MNIISYAQNFEDVMLWRALGHVQQGLYIDIGAQHPQIDSVSMAFHQAGWRGVHVEPVPAYADLLRDARPGDTVLQIALGDFEGTVKLHVFDDSGLSTAVDNYADQHRDQHGMAERSIHVPMLTMQSALRHLSGQQVHWMKIDVEGFEEQVLRGWDSAQLRPWILVVEATRPGSPDTDYAGWDPLVTAAGYRFVYFDGLNRFYLADEHPELARAFAAPPNVFDGAQLSGLASAAWCHRVLSEAEEKQRSAEAQAQWLRNEWDTARVHGEQAEKALAAHVAEHGRLAAIIAQQQADHDALALTAARELDTNIALREALLSERQSSEHVKAELEEQVRRAIAQHQQLEAVRSTLEEKVAELQHWSHHWYMIAEAREQARLDLIGSNSWRLTAPLRGASHLVRRLAGAPAAAGPATPSLRHRSVALARRVVRWSVRTVLSNDRLSQMARRFLVSHPGLKARLRRATVNADMAQQQSGFAAIAVAHPGQLSERAGKLYLEIRRAGRDGVQR